MKGFVNSIQSMGTLDGPGVRFVVFLQGCNLRCGCCHNPETWQMGIGDEYEAQEIAQKASRYTEYFGEVGGITVTGGEPLMQAKFVKEIFTLCHERGISTCLDTSGSILNSEIKALLEVTDHVLLDIKYTTDELYKKYVGCSLEKPMEFLKAVNEKGIHTVIRQVTVPTLNDTEQSILALKELIQDYECVEKIELLPFKKICAVKYEREGKDFAFKDIPTPTAEKMKELIALL